MLPLDEGLRCSCSQVAAKCFENLEVEEGLWTFARILAIDRTNKADLRSSPLAVVCRRIKGNPKVCLEAGSRS